MKRRLIMAFLLLDYNGQAPELGLLVIYVKTVQFIETL